MGKGSSDECSFSGWPEFDKRGDYVRLGLSAAGMSAVTHVYCQACVLEVCVLPDISAARHVYYQAFVLPDLYSAALLVPVIFAARHVLRHLCRWD